MDDLDDEILMVTSGTQAKKAKQERDDSDQSDSDGRDSMDSDDDDASYDRDQDAEYDDDVEPDDDNDADFTVSKKKAKRKPAAKKRAPAKSRPRKKPSKANPSRRFAPKVSMEGLDDDDEDQFQHEYDADGYGDQTDRDRLLKMTEIERESILEDRVEKRRREYDVWKMERQMTARAKRDSFAAKGQRSSTRNKESSKNAAIEDLMQTKHDKSRKLEDVSDADSEPGRLKRKHGVRSPGESSSEGDGRRRDEGMKDIDFDAGPELSYADIVKENTDDKGMIVYTTTPIFLRRIALVSLSQQPVLARAVEGMMVRVRVSDKSDRVGGSYLLCRIMGVETKKIYTFDSHPGVKSNTHLILQSGSDRKHFQMREMSSSHPTRSEWETFRKRWLEAGLQLPSRKEVNEMMKRASDLIGNDSARATEAELSAHMKNRSVVYPELTNWTEKKMSLTSILEVKVQDHQGATNSETRKRLAGEIKELEENLQHVREMEAKFDSKRSNAAAFQRIAAKNQKVNESMDRLAASRRNRSKSGAIDPYARFDMTGQSYFSIKGDAKTEGDKMAAGNVDEEDWRSTLRTWDPKEKRQKPTVEPLVAGFGVPMAGLEDFVWPPNAGWGKAEEGRGPPGVDCVYAVAKRRKGGLPAGAKVISVKEWNSMRS